MKSSTALTIICGALLLIGIGGCSKKPAPAPPVTPPPTTAEVSPPAAPTTPPVEAPAVRVELRDAYFDYDRSELKSDARAALTHNAECMVSDPNMKLLIEGHCDERGTIEYNLALGDRRARAAKDFLANYGVPPARIETISYGEERPFAPGHDESAWRQNRRAHFVAR
jgi:peptidoglycan-associated lipoprotein